MFWIWLSIIVVLIGGELNAETEHQTVRDTTIGGPTHGRAWRNSGRYRRSETGLIAANSREPDRIDEQVTER